MSQTTITKSVTFFHRDYQVPGIYLITNMMNGKVYVGQSTNLYKRYSRHARSVNHPDQYNRPIVAAFMKYGIHNFEFSILELVSVDLLTVREQFWIDTMRSYDRRLGYNACPAAGSTAGFKQSEETRRRVAKASSLRTMSAEARAKIAASRIGKPLPANVRLKISQAKLGTRVLTKRGVQVAQLCLETGLVLSVFRSASEASRSVPKTNFANILKVCKGGGRSCGGYGWRLHVEN